MIYFEILDSAGDPRVSGKNKYVHAYFSDSINVTATLYDHRMGSLTRHENMIDQHYNNKTYMSKYTGVQNM